MRGLGVSKKIAIRDTLENEKVTINDLISTESREVISSTQTPRGYQQKERENADRRSKAKSIVSVLFDLSAAHLHLKKISAVSIPH